MPDTETDIAFTDEILTDFEFTENGERNEKESEIAEARAEEREPQFDTTATSGERDALLAILEERGGEARDWTFVDRGDAGYHFDGTDIRDPDGNIWTNPDAELHEAMLAEWKEGEGAVFLLPDYVERTDEKETLYITTLTLDSMGQVGWEIHAHETPILKDEELGSVRESERQEESYEVRWEDIADEITVENDPTETTEAMLVAAAQESETRAQEEVDDTAHENVLTTQSPDAHVQDKELGTLLKQIFNTEPLMDSSPETDARVEQSAATPKEESSTKITPPVGFRAASILSALGITRPSSSQQVRAFNTPTTRLRPGTYAQHPIRKLLPGEVEKNGIRMRRTL